MNTSSFERNIKILYSITFLRSSLFYIPILALYLQEQLFTIVNVSIILSIITLGTAILEVPSGAVADRIGRKKTIIIANVMAVASALMLTISSSFYMFIVYALLAAINRSLYSGTDESLLYDSLKKINKEPQFKKVIGRVHAISPIGLSIASMIGGILATFSLRIPVVVSIIPLGIAFLISLGLHDPSTHKKNSASVRMHVAEALQSIKSNAQLTLLILASLLFFAFGESIHQLSQIFYEFQKIPLEYFGVLFFLVFLLSSLGALMSHSVSSFLGNKKTLISMTLLSLMLIISATYASGVIAVGLIILGSIPYGIRNPILSDLTNKEIQSKQRTTILSIRNLAGSISFSLFAPLLGLLSDALSITIAFRIFGIAYISLVVLFLFLKE